MSLNYSHKPVWFDTLAKSECVLFDPVWGTLAVGTVNKFDANYICYGVDAFGGYHRIGHELSLEEAKERVEADVLNYGINQY